MTNPAILIWTKRDTTCVQCDATKRALRKAGIDFIERPLEDFPDHVQAFKDEGLLGAPIVETANRRWSGFRPDLIKQIAKEQP